MSHGSNSIATGIATVIDRTAAAGKAKQRPIKLPLSLADDDMDMVVEAARRSGLPKATIARAAMVAGLGIYLAGKKAIGDE